MNAPKEKQKILVIKLGALGDFIQALGPMQAIRAHHKDAEITLLTTRPFKIFAQQCGYFDHVWIDEKPGKFDLGGWLGWRKRLNEAGFSRIYDLQNNDRTALYFRLLKKPKPEWIGAAKGASHRNASPERTAGHAFDGHVQTLALAGIKDITIDDLGWIEADIRAFELQHPYVLLVPGSAPQHPYKRWPAMHYARLAQMISRWGYQPVLLGTQAEAELNDVIARSAPGTLDLSGQTDLPQIAVLARGAAAAIGNDTGPMHLIAATGCPCLVLFSRHSNPKRHAPKGADVQILQKDDLMDLTPEEVIKKFRPREKTKPSATMH